MPAAAADSTPVVKSTLVGAIVHVYRSQPPLVLFALAMLALAVPALVALVVDPRMVHGVPNWMKPLKFMASSALFALTMAWVIGLMPEPARSARRVRALSWLALGMMSFEIAYITLQAALGVQSHYNTADPFHAAMLDLMALAAVLLVCTQAVLAWQLLRSVQTATVLILAVAAGLWLTCLLSIASGFLLGGLQPPPGVGLPVAGWHLGGADLRPSHFLAVHAQQLLPLAGFALQRLPARQATPALLGVVAAYVAAWAWLVFIAFARAG